MALPTKDKTWQYSVNNTKGASGTVLADTQQTVLQIKTSLIGFSTLPWTVSGSSNSSASSMDGTDRWSTSTNLVWGTGAHSWIVLRQTGLATKFELCFDLSNASSVNMTIVLSPANGFGTANGGTNGSTSARPTATDEIVVLSNTVWGDNLSSTQLYRVHCMQSTDGACTRVLVTNNLYPVTVLIADKPKNAISGWTTPWVMGFRASSSTTTSGARVQDWNDIARLNFKPSSSLTSGLLYMATPFVVSSSIIERGTGQLVNDLTGVREYWPIVYICDLPPLRGIWGETYDMYFGDPGLMRGVQFDSTPSKEWVYTNDLILPWDGSTNML